jgi:hypothetical protein
MLAEVRGAASPSPFAWSVAEAFTEIGEYDEALRWIEAAYDFRYTFMPWLGWYASFAPLRTLPGAGGKDRRAARLKDTATRAARTRNSRVA